MVQGQVLGRGNSCRLRRERCHQGLPSTGHTSTKTMTESLPQIIQLSSPRRPHTILILDSSPRPHGSATEAAPKSPSVTSEDAPTPYSITSVAWAPSCGRSYHLIATGSRDGHVRIWRVKPPALGEDGEQDAEEGSWSA